MLKAKRADFFKKQDTTDDTPSSYKATTACDKGAKTKPSIHTKNLNKCMVK